MAGATSGTRSKAAAARVPVPTDPAVLLDTELMQSGVAAAGILRRAGRRLGFFTVRDLLFHLPRRYDDLREMRQLGELVWVEDGTVVSARVRVVDVRVEASFRRRVQRTIAVLEDETGTIEATWFGRRFIERRLHVDDQVIVSGKLKRFGRKLTLDNPDFQAEGQDDELLHVGRIVPVYRLSAGLTANRLRIAIRDLLDRAGKAYPEYLPGDVLRGEELAAIGDALEEAHYPVTFEGRDAALRRLAFDELLALQLGMVARRRQRGRDAAPPDPRRRRGRRGRSAAPSRGRSGGSSSGTSSLTVDQDRAIQDIRGDLARPTPMLRLLQGDVGSGKTAVAAYALAAAARAGMQGALLAPTDLLARQHHRTLASLLEDAAIPVELLTGSMTAAAARQTLDLVASGQAPVVVGTHALIQERVSFASLGVVVIDEQHRFGVEQRGLLEAKAGGDRAPHVLLMTATPIPRTLGQVLYADLDVSDLRTPPEGRVPIRTGIRRPDELEGTWQKVRSEAALGHRIFVVVPLIDEADAADDAGPFDASAPAAEAEAVRLTELLAPLRVGLVHGRLKAADRDAEMARFRDGDLDVLVGTTVVEVGVDVAEATMMIVEGADRFGLAQLHQLRGRVGRGTVESFCVLVSDSVDETAQARLKAVAEMRDGFELAERDFELRREGDVLGLAQSGLPRLRVASLQDKEHVALAKRARERAEALLDDRGDLPRSEAALRHELEHGWLGAGLGRRARERRVRLPVAAVVLGLRANAGQFALLVGVQVLIGAMVGQERTVVPLMATQIFGLSGFAAALTFLVAFGVTKSLANLAAGMLADRYGRRPVLIAGWIVGLPVPLLLIWAPAWEWVVLANVLLGINQGLTWSVAVIMKVDLVGPRQRGLALGLNEAAGYCAVAGMALLTGFIAEQAGLRPAPFVLGFAVAVTGLVISAFAIRETSDHVRLEQGLEERGPRPSWRSVVLRTTFTDPSLSAASQAGLVNNLNDAMAWGLLPLFYAAAGLPLTAIATLAATYPFVWGTTQLVTGALSDRDRTEARSSPAGMLVQAAAIADDSLGLRVRAVAGRERRARRRDGDGLSDAARRGGRRRRAVLARDPRSASTGCGGTSGLRSGRSSWESLPTGPGMTAAIVGRGGDHGSVRDRRRGPHARDAAA